MVNAWVFLTDNFIIMKLPTQLLYFILLITCTFFTRQNIAAQQFHVISSFTGDLNKDGSPDSVVVLQDTIPDPAPYEIKIFFKQPAGSYKFIVSSRKAIEPRMLYSGNSFETVTIKNNVLTITYSLLRGNYENKFRYQNGNFELIGHTDSNSDGRGTISSTDFNLSTGRFIHTQENYETGKLLKKTDKIIRIKPLPKLQDFIPYDTDKPGVLTDDGFLF